MRNKWRYLAALLLSCYLGVHNGYVSLWQNGASQPSVVFPYPVDALPEADRAALYEGIPYSGEKELSRLLEDYLS